VVTDVLGGGKFYVQTEEARVGAIQKALEGLRLKDKPMVQGMFVPQKGETVIAQFSSDGSWNRALVSGGAGDCMRMWVMMEWAWNGGGCSDGEGFVVWWCALWRAGAVCVWKVVLKSGLDAWQGRG
jgi:hypothetical protein